jgi:hypothetical protein
VEIPARPVAGSGPGNRRLRGISRYALLGIALILAAFAATFYLATRTASLGDIPVRPEARPGFRSAWIIADLPLKETARNWKYYQIMTSVCHRAGKDRIAAAYAYLFYSADRYSQSGKWSAEQFAAAVDSTIAYYEIDPAIECRADALNLHGLDVDADLRLQTRALNYVFYNAKVSVCEQAGNKVQARTYVHLADSERAKLNQSRRGVLEVNAAIAEARESPDLHRVDGC